MQNDRNTAVFYTCAVCNLNCKYCYIDKNRALVHIDEELDKSFQGDYYFDFVKEMFPSFGQLQSIETWGGEPFLHMDRIYYTLRRIIEYYPFFRNMYSSTNFSFPEWPEQFFGLMELFGKYPDRPFNYLLQLSLDGPEYINDYSRGSGTTKKCLKNYQILVESIYDRLPPNVTLTVVFKPTLDIESTKMLDTREKIIEYYRMFENLIEQIWELRLDNVKARLPVPNTACPSPVTVEDGRIFANLCRMCRELEAENLTSKIFDHYDIITPYAFQDDKRFALTYRYPNYTCGIGYTHVGLLPNRMISTCHSSFVDLVSEYKDLVTRNKGKNSLEFKAFLDGRTSRLTMTVDEYLEFERQMHCYNCEGTSARLANIASLINTLAYAGQVEDIYKDQKAALEAAIFLQNHTSYCVRDNYNTTGSITLIPVGIPKLLLNGAKQYIEGPIGNSAE